MLPSRFILMGVMIYIAIELIGSAFLQYIPGYQDKEQLVITVMRFCELLGFAFIIKHFRMLESLGLSKPSSQDVRIFLIISTLCTLIVGVLYLIQPEWFTYIKLPEWLHGVTGLFLMVVLAPIVEELVFRGLVYRMLREQWGVFISVGISAVFFSLLHHGLIVSPQLAGGIIFAFAYEWSRSLWVSIALHMGANSAVYVLSMMS